MRDSRRLIYTGSGILDGQTAEYVKGMTNDYPYVVEVVGLHGEPWKKFIGWAEKNFPQYTFWINSGSTGEDYQTSRVLYGVVNKNGDAAGSFMCFKSQKEKQMFIEAFEGFVTNKDPFRCEL